MLQVFHLNQKYLQKAELKAEQEKIVRLQTLDLI